MAIRQTPQPGLRTWQKLLLMASMGILAVLGGLWATLSLEAYLADQPHCDWAHVSAQYQTDGSVRVNWHTYRHRNGQTFSVERSQGGQPFRPIYSMDITEDIAQLATYLYVDNDPPLQGPVRYRVRFVGNDGSVEVSPVATCQSGEKGFVSYQLIRQ